MSDTSMVRPFVGPTLRWSDKKGSLLRHLSSPTMSLVLHAVGPANHTCPTRRWSKMSLVRQRGDMSLVRHLIGPTIVGILVLKYVVF